jgi:hypothetical protein
MGVAPDQSYLPERLKGRRYYVPKAVGREKARDGGRRTRRRRSEQNE